MTGVVLPFTPRHQNIPRVELSSPGRLRDGRSFYILDVIEADGARSSIWDGTDLGEGRQAGRECVADGLPFRDLTGGAA